MHKFEGSRKLKIKVLSKNDHLNKFEIKLFSANECFSPMSIEEIKNNPIFLRRLDSIDVNYLNDLHYKNDNITRLIIEDEVVKAIYEDGAIVNFNINDDYDFLKSSSCYLYFIIGYMKAEKIHEKLSREIIKK